jgi:hypothetical protein
MGLARFGVAAGVLGALAMAACAPREGVRVEAISLERPGEGLGLPPPPDYEPCIRGEARGYDTNGDGRPDVIRVAFQGKDRCYGEDSDHDGKIDTWDLADESGKIIKRAHDANGDGKPDQTWTFDPTRKGCAHISSDLDGDGKPDYGGVVDFCAPAPAPATKSLNP